ncbi:MAG: AEC family transporter [Thermoleophilia bacterium]|nr:AEC family transporter [Thermoleophilia bacterium]
MHIDLLLFAVFAVIGLRLQRRADSDQLRERLWMFNYMALIPAAAIYTCLTIDLTGHLLLVAICASIAWWTTVGVSYIYARLVATSPAQQGALLMAGAFPNTGFIGLPLATLAFGTAGLRGAVIYDQVGLIVPAIVVSNLIATHYARLSGEVSDAVAQRSLAHDLLVNPPLWAALGALLARATIVQQPVGNLEWLGTSVGHVVGPVGFLLLGLSLPLERFSHDKSEVSRAAGAIAIRLFVGPLLLLMWAQVMHVHVPPVVYLIAGMPTAFHVLVITRLHGLDPPLIRLTVVASTVIAVVGVAIGVALAH